MDISERFVFKPVEASPQTCVLFRVNGDESISIALPQDVIDYVDQIIYEAIGEIGDRKKYFAQMAMTEDVHAYNEGLDRAIFILQSLVTREKST